MFGSEIIDVGIGMALLFLFMSLIAAALREVIENYMKTRAKDLEKGLIELLRAPDDRQNLVKTFYENPFIASLYKGDKYEPGSKDLPSYVPRQNAALAILDMIWQAGDKTSPLSPASLKASIDKMQAPAAVHRVVDVALATAGNDLDKVRKAVEEWFDSTMDRVSGWYTRRTSYILAGLGFAAAVFFNVDAITVAKALFKDKQLRAAVVATAEEVVKNGPPGAKAADAKLKQQEAKEEQGAAGQKEPDKSVKDASAKGAGAKGAGAAGAGVEDGGNSAGAKDAGAATVETLKNLTLDFTKIGFPIGWLSTDWLPIPKPQMCVPKDIAGTADGGETLMITDDGIEYRCVLTPSKWFATFFGWLITALAITLGAPFWFDVLNKFMVVRSTIKPKEKSPDEASVDRQPARRGARR